ncbi:MAG TPA: aldo/keto reductase [Nannocystaceae bacterium]|nr:aldo/keto reductase [Nannocystaceae bacterium]
MTTRATVRLGATGPEVFPIALGCMGFSGIYGSGSDEEAIATIHAAIERGVDLLDTGDFYGMGHNEMLVGKAIAGRRDQVKLSVKFGAQRGPDGSWLGVDTRPAAVSTALAYSLQRLGVDYVDVYRPARLDPNVPIEDTVGAISRLIEKGYVRHIGLSEVGPNTIRRAHAVHPIADLQIEYAVISRAPEQRIFPLLDELGISATCYGILSRGLLSGSKPTGAGDFRKHLPRFSAENREGNDAVVQRFASFAADHRMTPAQLAIAWMRAKQPGFVALVGMRTPTQLADALAAEEHRLDAAALAELERLIPADAIAGTRYAAPQMAHLDSER